jgi:hypothetical protein
MEAKGFTPGPWLYEYGAVYQAAKGRIVLADRDNPETLPTERDANLRLCAAAPDLLAALEKIDANAAESAEWIRSIIRPAIAKAKGA